MTFYNIFTPSSNVHTAPEMQQPPVGTGAYCALTPTDEKPLSTRDYLCKSNFGAEYSAQLGDYYGTPGCLFGSTLWTTRCRRAADAPRTGDPSFCCLNFGASGDTNKSCPVGTNDPRSGACLSFWTQRCNTDPGSVDSNVCKYVWDAQVDPKAMGPFVRRRCFSADRAANMLGGGDPFCTACAKLPEFKDDVAAICNDPKYFNDPAMRIFCKNWCKTVGNPGACDATMPAYCASAEGKDDPACGCFSTYSAYDTDVELKALKTAGMVRCADPCTNGSAYLTKSASTIGTCCAQLNNISQSQAAAIGGVQLANINQKMNCGVALPETNVQAPVPEIPQAQPPSTSTNKWVIFFIFLVIITIIGAIVIVAWPADEEAPQPGQKAQKSNK